jgi:cellulose synthase/poly-beta-1,6-N-acetylglucosamine synthase-like glycosyltransferase
VTALGVALLLLSLALGGYAYLGYPLLLRLLPRTWRPPAGGPPGAWPAVTVTLAVYNEEHEIGGTLEALLATDYPAERRHIVVISDASNDRTDEIVRSFAARGVELLRLPQRSGKTAAENASRARIRGDIVVNTDASVRIPRDALKALVDAFRDASVGVASGRDVSVGDERTPAAGESGYVGYEMWVRDLETRAGGIVGASGCFYASRRALHQESVPDALSRDFAAPLIAHEHGYRAVSVRDAICFVPRAQSLRREYRRKVRTMARGLRTLFYKRHLLNPLRHGRFAVMLLSHKLARWLVPLSLVPAVAGLGLMAIEHRWLAGLLFAGALLAAGVTFVAWRWAAVPSRVPSVVGALAYLAFGIGAAFHAWLRAIRQDLDPVWEPTRR